MWHWATQERYKEHFTEAKDCWWRLYPSPEGLSVSLALTIVHLKSERMIDGDFIHLFIYIFINVTHYEFLLCVRHLLSPGYMAVNKRQSLLREGHIELKSWTLHKDFFLLHVTRVLIGITRSYRNMWKGPNSNITWGIGAGHMKTLRIPPGNCVRLYLSLRFYRGNGEINVCT